MNLKTDRWMMYEDWKYHLLSESPSIPPHKPFCGKAQGDPQSYRGDMNQEEFLTNITQICQDCINVRTMFRLAE